MTFDEIFHEARQIDAMSPLSVAFTQRWNKLEDHLARLPEAAAADIMAQAEAKADTHCAAHVIITMLEEGRV